MENYSVEEGLPSPEVYDMIQDQYGYLWFATDHGLSRYNGYEFENFGLKDGITNNTVFQFFEQENGNIWCSTFDNTLFYFNGKNPVFYPFQFNDILTSKLSDKWVSRELYVDKNGLIFISYVDRTGYIKIDKTGKLTCNECDEEIEKKLRPQIRIYNKKNVFSYVSQKESINKQFLYSDVEPSVRYVGACYLDTFSTNIIGFEKQVVIASSLVNTILYFESKPIAIGKYDKTHFWVSFRFGGVKFFDFKGLEVNYLLRDKYVTDILIDHEGVTWASTLSSGVFKFKNIGVTLVNSMKGEEWIESLTVDDKQTIYAGGYKGTLYQLSSDSLISIFEPKHKYPTYVDYYKGSMYFNTIHGFFKKDVKIEPIYDKGVAKWTVHDDIFVFTWYGYIDFLGKDSIESSFTNDLRILDIHSFNNNLFVGTKHGLYTIDIQKQELFAFRHKEKILTQRIDALEHVGNSLLVGTRGYGLGLIRDTAVQIIDKSKGLVSDYISKIFVENSRDVWLCTNAGLNLVRFTKDKYKIYSFTYGDGLPSNQVSDVLVLNDTVWVSTRKGVCHFAKVELLEKLNKHTPCFLSFLGVKVNDVELSENQLIDLDYNENRVEINFYGISFKSNASLVYRYKLLGQDDKWTYTTSRRVIYSNLQPGNYEFAVQAICQSSHKVNDKISLNIHIALPYWETWWFQFGITGLVLLLIMLFFKYNILSYNRDIIRELLRQLLKRIKQKSKYLIIREQGKDIRIDTNHICFVKSEGNYIEIHTDENRYVIRCKIGDFMMKLPDAIEFLRVHRSYIIRIDKVEQKGVKDLFVKGISIPVGKTYLKELSKINL